MSEQFRITISPEAEAILRTVRTMPEWMAARIAKAMDGENIRTINHIQKDFLQFPKDGPTTMLGCRMISNRLRGSIFASKSVPSPSGVTSAIGSNVVYAAALEFGADIPPRVIRPVNAKALRFMIGGRLIFAKSAKLPGFHLEGRHFIRRGILDRMANYSRAFSDAIVTGWNENGKN